MKVIALGSGGWIPSDTRHTSCFLVDTGESLILLDSGSGLSRLSKYLDILDKYDEINIIYSHYHLDHIMGLYYISNWSKEKKINIYGPGKALGFKSCEEVISGLIKPPYYPITIDNFAKKVNIKDYDLQGFKIGSTTVKIIPQIHSGNSFGISLGDQLHYATDTIALENTFKEAEGKKLLLHECWTIISEQNGNHTSYEEINDMLTKFKVEKLGFIHINPNWKADRFKALMSFPQHHSNIVIVEDEMVFEL
jgi:ribonuclease BN (tRNA processing enzyme)